MSVHPSAGAQIRADQLVDVVGLLNAYHDLHPDPADPAQRVSFGTSGHRGSSIARRFNEAHVLAITQAICDYRKSARAISAGVHDRSRGADRERRLDDDR
jgi:phosphoglucomutase